MGSTNFNSRSFNINDKANLNVYCTAFDCWQIKIFETYLKSSKLIMTSFTAFSRI